MSRMKLSTEAVGFALALVTVLAWASTEYAACGLRQYYDTTWSYSRSHNYYYVNYYYQTTASQGNYDYHYCIYYPSQPSYIYYYNPSTQLYWGRYKIGSPVNERYSILAQSDRKKDLKDIPEAAFPAPAAMPDIPGSSDNVAMDPPPENVPANSK